MVTGHVQTGNALAEDLTPPGFTRSARTPASASCQDVTASKALELAEDRRFWRTIATAEGYG